MTTTKPQSTTEERLEPCPWCPTTRRETHETEAGTVGIIFHSEGCIFDGRQVLNPRGVKVWNTRISPASAAPVVDRQVTTKALLDAVDAFCGQFETLGERFKKQLRNAVRAAIRAVPAAATAAPQTKSCGFCGKSDQEVKVLIQAPVGYICDECVAVCASIIERNRTAAPVDQSDDAANEAASKIAEYFNAPPSVIPAIEQIIRRCSQKNNAQTT